MVNVSHSLSPRFKRTGRQRKHRRISFAESRGIPMRDFRDAKLMARSLCEALKPKSITLTHSESLEVIAAIFGVDDWNVLSAQIKAVEELSSKGPYCTFCKKSSSEIEALVAGPGVYICDACI